MPGQKSIGLSYQMIRQRSEDICSPLQVEDYVVQPAADVSPPKWHLGHTTWFFETFILKPYVPAYREFSPDYNYVFNSYYETVGARVIRTDRGNLGRPTVADVIQYRRYVDSAMNAWLRENEVTDEIEKLIVLGLNHEQQHQELLLTDIKYILGHNPLFPAYNETHPQSRWQPGSGSRMVTIGEGVYEIGADGDGFCWDNEQVRHKVYLNQFSISDSLVTNKEYFDFMKDGGYTNFRYWHAEGWDWVKANRITAPMYWHLVSGRWMNYTFRGLVPVNKDEPVCHISYYEAYAFAAWKGMRLPTEFEWEIAAARFAWGERWEWTESAYLPYPNFIRAEGALGEYNGKFMVNQHVLRGASEVTPTGHSRVTYRNFFHASSRWQFTGIRLAR